MRPAHELRRWSALDRPHLSSFQLLSLFADGTSLFLQASLDRLSLGLFCCRLPAFLKHSKMCFYIVHWDATAVSSSPSRAASPALWAACASWKWYPSRRLSPPPRLSAALPDGPALPRKSRALRGERRTAPSALWQRWETWVVEHNHQRGLKPKKQEHVYLCDFKEERYTLPGMLRF